MATTIADLARLAGVSKSTVSRALNDSPLIGPETKERIRGLAREHRFQPNEPARRLTTKQSNVAAFVTYAYTKADFAVPDAFMLEMMSGITAGLHANGYDLLVVQIEPGDTEWIARYLGSGRVDGFILTSAHSTQQHLDALRAVRAPFVLWGARPGRNDVSTVSGDNASGGRIATAHLLTRGCARVGFIGGSRRTVESLDRYGGYEQALAHSGIELDAELVVYGDYSPASGAVAMRTLLDRGIDGVFASSDLMALAAMDEIRARGLRVPDDVAVVGYDDIALAEQSDPPLTTVAQNIPLAARMLAESLVQSLRTGSVTKVTIPAELVVRASA